MALHNIPHGSEENLKIFHGYVLLGFFVAKLSNKTIDVTSTESSG